MTRSVNNLTDRELLEEILKTQQEDHQKINKINSRQRFQFVVAVLKWTFYVAVAIGLYAFFQPYVENVTGVYVNLKEGIESLNEIRSNLPNFPFLK